MMQKHPSPKGPVPAPGSLHGMGWDYARRYPPTTVVNPAKRPASQDDDDIQIISEKPVKRRRNSERQVPISVPRHPMNPLDTEATAAASAAAPNTVPNFPSPGGSKDSERRLSTGMVGLPKDIQAMELTCALRGVSMPVLENFVLDQPSHTPRPLSPELSPKQLPLALSQSMLHTPSGRLAPGTLETARLPNSPVVYQSPRHRSYLASRPGMTSGMGKTAFDTSQAPTTVATGNMSSHVIPISTDDGNGISPKSTQMPLPIPCPGIPQGVSSGSSPRPSDANQYHINSTRPQKRPCQACSQLRLQSHLSRAQGLSMVNATLPTPFPPQLHPTYHPTYHQHMNPQILAMAMGNAHQYGPGMAPALIPVNSGPFVSLPSRPAPQPPRQPNPQHQTGPKKDNQPTQATSELTKNIKSPQPSQLKNTAAGPIATSSPIKPPASLIKPTYRKPSPNLIVDVAETCQEKFPFEEVAKRHNVPVEKVFEVFAAIIQVPLLRCPTDRRRAGKLATTRIKEYNKAKKDFLDTRTSKDEANKPEAVVDSRDISQTLGPVEFPAGFTVGWKS